MTIIAGFCPLPILFIESLFLPINVVEKFLGIYWVVTVLIMFFIYAMRFSWTRVVKLVEYARQMSRDTTGFRVHSPLRPSWVLLSWLGLLVGITLLFGLPEIQAWSFQEEAPLTSYFFLIVGSFILVYGYSMFLIYRMGKLPLELKPFTQDTMLGLGPFGDLSLVLIAVYAVFPAVVAILNSLPPDGQPISEFGFKWWRPGDYGLSAALFIIGVVLFFLPLFSIHRKMVEAKRKELTWISPQYTGVVSRMRQADESQRSKLADELSLIRQIQADIRQIREWPFNHGTIARLATVLVLPSLLAVTGRIMIIIILAR